MVDTDDDDDDENDDTQYIIPPELHGSDPNEKLGASSSEDTYNDEEIVADLNEILSPNANDKLLLVHNSNNSASSSHQKSGLSRASTKSVLTMDFDINDLSVAPDYEFREKSPRFGASLAPESPEKQPISPLSALPPSVNGTSIIGMKV